MNLNLFKVSSLYVAAACFTEVVLFSSLYIEIMICQENVPRRWVWNVAPYSLYSWTLQIAAKKLNKNNMQRVNDVQTAPCSHL